MKVLFYSLENEPARGQSPETRWASHLAEAGHEVHMVTQRPVAWTEHYPEHADLHVHQLKTLSPNHVQYVTNKALSACPSPDVAFSTTQNGSALLRDLDCPTVCQVLDVPLNLIQVGDNGPWHEGWRHILTDLQHVDHVILNTDQATQDLWTAWRHYTLPPETYPDTSLVWYGVDTTLCDAASPVNPLPDQYQGQASIGTISRHIWYKGLDLGYLALSQLPSHYDPVYVLVGDGPDTGRLLQQGHLHGVPTSILDPVDHLTKFGILKHLDLVLYLGHNHHTGSLLPLEAAYAGTPCLTWDLSIHWQRAGDHGVHYVQPYDVSEVARILQAYLDGQATHLHVSGPDKSWIRGHRSLDTHATGIRHTLESIPHE